MQIGFGDIKLVLRRRILVVVEVVVVGCFFLYLTNLDGTRVLLQHLSVRWCWSTQNVNPWPRPAPLTPKSSILPSEPLPWQIHSLKPRCNLPWRCLRQQRCLRVFCASISCHQIFFPQLTALKRRYLATHPSQPNLDRIMCVPSVRLLCRCKLCLCISITEDLGKNSGMPAHLICYGNTCG